MPKIKRSYIVLVLILVPLLLVGALIFYYAGIKIRLSETSDDYTEVERSFIDGEEYNVVLLGFNSESYNYKFLETIVIVSVNSVTSEVKTMGINPFFSVGLDDKTYSINSLWNNLEGNREEKIASLIQSLIGVRIDRYISFNISDISKLIKDWGVGYEVTENVAESSNVKKGEYISGDKLSEYLFGKSITENDSVIVESHLNFINYLFKSNKNVFFVLRVFLEAGNLSDVFFTNLAKNELYYFLLALYNADSRITTGVLNLNYCAKNENGDCTAGSGISEFAKLDILQSDLLIKSIFQDLNILKEQARVEVYNATDSGGLASKISRMLSNNGFDVIKIGNYTEILENTVLAVPENNLEDVLNNRNGIRRLLSNKIILQLGEYKNNYVGDLVLILGKDAL